MTLIGEQPFERLLKRGACDAVLACDDAARGGPNLSRKALEVERARLARFFETINKHRKALDLAVEQNFDGELDAAEWRKAFESAEPHDANRTMVVTGDHSAMLSRSCVRRFPRSSTTFGTGSLATA